MTGDMRRTGIEIIGDSPWGTHFCQFYKTKEDLIEILVPYFKAGLENNEFCMWITAEPLSSKDARAALSKVVKDLGAREKRGQIEILDYTQWYTPSGKFNSDKVLAGWVEKEKEALKKGFEGLRLTGNTFWLEKEDWKDFFDYEAAVNSVIGEHRMMAICTYSLDRCEASELLDVVANHQFALIRRGGRWEIVESSERKKADQELREAEENLRNTFNISPGLITTADANLGIFTQCNLAVTRMLGYSVEGFTSRPFVEFIHPDDRKGTADEVTRQLAGSPVANFENRYRCKDGSFKWLSWQATAADKNGKVYAVATDITDRKKVEDELFEATLRQQEAVSSGHIGLWNWDLRTDKVTFSREWKAQIGYEEHEISDDYAEWEKRLHPDDLESTLKNVKKVIKECGRNYKVEFRFRHKNGSYRWILAQGSVIQDNTGQPARLIGSHVDITDRKKTEEALRIEKDRAQSYLDIAHVILIALDIDGVVTMINQRGCQVLGYAQDEIVGKNWFDNFVPPRIRDEVLPVSKGLLNGKIETFSLHENPVLTKTGQERIVEWYNAAITNDEGVIVGHLSSGEDITDRKNAEEELQKHRDHLEELVKEKTGELHEKVKELQTFYDAAVDRELKMEEMRKRIAELEGKDKR